VQQVQQLRQALLGRVEVRIDWYVLVPALQAISKDVDVNR
jgi:hypothetical protein